MPQNTWMKTLALTFFALTAFAANSVLCRLALGQESIDAAGFTLIRLLSGILMLGLILLLKGDVKFPTVLDKDKMQGSWLAAAMLFGYAITFSYAYITLDTATGALILFASVQISMILLSVIAGSRLHLSEWIGLLMAFAGFVYLILPGLSTPSLEGFILMVVSGIAWGVYTLKGKGSKNPLGDTAWNFIRTLPLLIILFVFSYTSLDVSPEGVMYAVLSGALASGVGYSIWYAALKGLSSTQAAVLQLLVPIIAAFGGVIFVAEPVTARLMISATIILGGILLVVLGKKYFSSQD